MIQVIKLSGKAKSVFRFLELLARFKGNTRLGDLSK